MPLTQNNNPQLHWQFPHAAKFGRVISKEKIYQQANVNAELKQLFVEQVAQIKWAYKLAQNTVNLSKTPQVEEIEIIQIKLKTQTLDEKILTAIDKAIPHPTVFILIREQQGQVHAQNEAQEKGIVEIAYKAAHKQKVNKAGEGSKTQKKSGSTANTYKAHGYKLKASLLLHYRQPLTCSCYINNCLKL